MMTDLVSVAKTDRIAIVRFDRGNNADAPSCAIICEITSVVRDLAGHRQQPFSTRII